MNTDEHDSDSLPARHYAQPFHAILFSPRDIIGSVVFIGAVALKTIPS
jgi:hypothetical protein